jgi:hypothetical protein
MDVPAASLQVRLRARSGIALDDPVSLDLGFDGETERVFTGTVVRVRPLLSGCTVWAIGKMKSLLDLRTSQTFEGQAAGSIAETLIGEAGLDTDTIDEGPVLPRFAVDKGQSAFRHLKGLADRLGFELYADRDGAVRFHALGDAAGLDAGLGGLADTAASMLTGGGGSQYAFGQHLLRAGARKRKPAWGSVHVGGESPMSSQGEDKAHWLTVDDADFAGSAGSDAPERFLRDPLARTKDLADRFAAGWKNVADRTAHILTFEAFGQPDCELGDTISVAEVSDGLQNGSGYVRGLRHAFGVDTGFVTRFRISVGGGS